MPPKKRVITRTTDRIQVTLPQELSDTLRQYRIDNFQDTSTVVRLALVRLFQREGYLAPPPLAPTETEAPGA